MDAKLEKFLAEAKAQKRKAFEDKRDNHLRSLGLTTGETIRKYSDKDSDKDSNTYEKWDEKAQMYYTEVEVPITVTDEEYEEILKYAPKQNDEVPELDTKAENFLAIMNVICLAAGIIAAIAILYKGTNSSGDFKDYMIEALAIAGVSLISWAIWKVVLNISYNLHEINNKLKR